MRHFRSGPEIFGKKADAEILETGEVFLKFPLTVYCFAMRFL